MTTNTPTVVSTTPSGTEILYALGVEPAAVSHACDYPPAVADKPRLNTSRIDATDSADRDTQATGDVYDVDVALLCNLEPDLIVTQSVCGVCAVDEQLVRRHLDDLSTEPTVLPLRASSVDDVVECIHEVGAAVGRPERAADVAGHFEGKIDGLRARTEPIDDRPDVAVIEWLDPLHGSANWVPELVTAAGGTYPFAAPGQRSVDLAWPDLRSLDPDVIVVSPCSFDVDETRAELSTLRERPHWTDLRAVRDGEVYALDGRLLNRWTPRLAEAADRLSRTLHPRLFADDGQLTPLV